MAGSLISVQDAHDHVGAYEIQCPVHVKPIDACLGYRLAAPIVSRLTHPPFDLSAMDGFAVRFDDVRQVGSRVTLVGEVAAGQQFPRSLRPGEAVRISTGGGLPNGADHVLIQEHATRDGNIIIVRTPQEKPRNIRRAGLDFSHGDQLVPAGAILGPAEIAIAAAANHASLDVLKPVNVAIIANGSELRPPGSNLEPGNIVSSNPSALAALLQRCGANVHLTGIAADDRDSIKTHIETASQADVILPIGGASVGDHDHMRQTFHDIGLDLHFAGIAIKPGKPTWFGTLNGTPVLGLPGNPLAAYICGFLFATVLLGRPALSHPTQARLAAPLAPTGDKEVFTLAKTFVDAGQFSVRPNTHTDTSRLRSLLASNCVIRRPANGAGQDAGDLVDTLSLPNG